MEISGHTDTVGRAAYNLQLSQRRADAVRTYLQGKGIDRSRMTTVGYGETRLRVSPEQSDADQRKNRRVELRKL